MNPFFQTPDQSVKIWCADRSKVTRLLVDSRVNLILEDTPYFKVKKAKWDNQWPTADDYLDWLDQELTESQRILSPNGSLYQFASSIMSTQVETLVRKRFHVLNNIRWYKSTGWHRKTKKEDLRSFLSPWEAIIFAEHYNADTLAAKMEGNQAKGVFVFEPLRAYLADEWKRAGLTFAQANEACGVASMAGRHYFSISQWCFPTQEHYESMQRYANQSEPQRYLQREYDFLQRDYQVLKAQFERSRRVFNMTSGNRYTDDVWFFETVKAGQGRHICEKPEPLIRYMIETSTRPGDIVFDGYMGAGTTLKCAWDLGRIGIGCDISPINCEKAANRFNQKTLW